MRRRSSTDLTQNRSHTSPTPCRRSPGLTTWTPRCITAPARSETRTWPEPLPDAFGVCRGHRGLRVIWCSRSRAPASRSAGPRQGRWAAVEVDDLTDPGRDNVQMAELGRTERLEAVPAHFGDVT